MSWAANTFARRLHELSPKLANNRVRVCAIELDAIACNRHNENAPPTITSRQRGVTPNRTTDWRFSVSTNDPSVPQGGANVQRNFAYGRGKEAS